MHSLLTILESHRMDNLWANCGSPVNPFNSSRIVGWMPVDMP